MSEQPIISQRVLVGWVAAAVVVFAISLFFMGGGQIGEPASVGPNTYSHSAIGHAGFADVLQRLDISVVKSRSNSLQNLSRGGVLVIAEPIAGGASEEVLRTLLKADTILLVLPKWDGARSQNRPDWVGTVALRPVSAAQWALRLVASRADVVRENASVNWTTNAIGLAPNTTMPIQLMRGDQLAPIIAGENGMLVGEIRDRNQRIWVLSDPDIIANHGLARPGNAALAVALIEKLRAPTGKVVFDEAIHGFTATSANPFLLAFRFPFVIASLQAAVAIGLLLWASMARFGAPQSAPPALSAGRQGLLQNVSNLIASAGHQQVIVRRYVQETIRDVARQLHAPAGLSGAQLVEWLQRVGNARGATIDCGALAQRAAELSDSWRPDQAQYVRLARDIYRWKREIIDGPSGNPRTH